MKYHFLNTQLLGFLLTGTILLGSGCRSDVEYWETKPEEMVISQFIESNPDFSEFNDILEATGFKSCLSVRGPYTLFLPGNQQMKEYYALKGVKSYNDFSADFLKQLVLNHIIKRQVETNEIGLGAITELNAIEDYISSEFDGKDIILNKNSKIIKRDIYVSNGIVHLIDKVLDPVTKSIFEVLESNPDFSIFTEGLKRTHIADTLKIISVPFGTKTTRSRFTVLAIADTTFHRFGIYSVEDLIARFTDEPTNISNRENGFYRYMEYHCLAETYFLNQFMTDYYPVLSFEIAVSMTVDFDYRIDLEDNKRFTGFYIEQSNIPAKNGAIHTINDLLPEGVPKPRQIVWEVTDHVDLKQGDYYLKYSQRFFDGQNTFANIKWSGNYLLYFCNTNACCPINFDFLMMEGWWWIEVTTPKIMKGKYKVYGNTGWGSVKSIFEVTIDGENTVFIAELLLGETYWGEFNWTKTETHKVKLVAKSAGELMWDAITFEPVK